MTIDFTKIESLFERLQAGNTDVLVEIIEAERARVFDYLLRMTGQRDSSIEVLDEVTKVLGSHPEQFCDIQALRVSLYATARSFSADRWNADTSQLINEGYSALEQPLAKANLDVNTLKKIERDLSGLPPWEREPIILQLRSGFLGGEVADIMSIDEMSCGYSFKSGIAKLGRAADLDFDTIEIMVGKIPGHPLSLQTYESTMALSQIMDDIGSVRKSVGFRWRLPVVILALGGAAAYFLFFH